MIENQHSKNEQPFPPLFECARKSAVLLLRIESLLLLGIFGYMVYSALTKSVEAPGALAGVLLASLAGAGGLFFASMAFANRRSTGRAPALLANLIGLGVSYFMITGHLLAIGSFLALLSGVTAIATLLGYTE